MATIDDRIESIKQIALMIDQRYARFGIGLEVEEDLLEALTTVDERLVDILEMMEEFPSMRKE